MTRPLDGYIAPMTFKTIFSAAAAAAVLFSAAPALAAPSIGGGVYTSSGDGQSASGAAIELGTSAGIPAVPVTVGLTGFVPLARGGGYAITLDASFSTGNDAFGAGYGVGQFAGARSGGTITAFYDHRIAPLTTLELRGYKTVAAGGGTAGFLGVKFSL